MRVGKIGLIAMCGGMAVTLLAGCGFTEEIQVNPDYSGKVTTKIYYSRNDFENETDDYTEEDLKDYEVEKIGGDPYYYDPNEVESEEFSAKDAKEIFVVLNKSKAEMALDYKKQDPSEMGGMGMIMEEAKANGGTTSKISPEEALKEMGLDFYTLQIKYPKKVLKANGSISKDGKTVTYNLVRLMARKTPRLYAAMNKKAITSKKISISGVKNHKVYKKPRVVKVSSPGVIKWIKVNGKLITSNRYKAKKKGKYKVVVKLLSGKKKTVRFRIR